MSVRVIPVNSPLKHFLSVLITQPSQTLPQSEHPFLAIALLWMPDHPACPSVYYRHDHQMVFYTQGGP